MAAQCISPTAVIPDVVHNQHTKINSRSSQPCSTTEDGLYPMGEIDLSTKILLFLRPLTSFRGGLVRSIQINTIPLSLSHIHEGVAGS